MSKERDVLHLHLPLCHVVHLNILTIRNKTAVNIHVHIFGETFFFTHSEVTMSPRPEARQLKVEKGQVYSVQSHSLKTAVSEWKLEQRRWDGKSFW